MYSLRNLKVLSHFDFRLPYSPSHGIISSVPCLDQFSLARHDTDLKKPKHIEIRLGVVSPEYSDSIYSLKLVVTLYSIELVYMDVSVCLVHRPMI